MDINTIYVNGIDLDEGTPAIPAMSTEAFAAMIGQAAKRGHTKPANLSELKTRAEQPQHLGVKAGIDPKKLNQAGWGAIFASDADPEVEEALQPLFDVRRQQATEKYYRVYNQDKGYQVGQNDNKNKFLKRLGMGPGPADPDRVPYYLLIVGGPETIPFEFQTELDVQYAVGRICFDTPAEYAAYARSVVAAEQARVKLARRLSFFGVKDDNATDEAAQAVKLSADYLVGPLSRALSGTAGWHVDTLLGAAATRAELVRRLGGEQTPALLFAATHGLNVKPDPTDHLRQSRLQGALVCTDPPGAAAPGTEGYLAGKHLGSDANLLGMVAFFFACFSAGTPLEDGYTRLRRLGLGQQPGPALELGPQPFVSYLPQRMLSTPAGGALAVIGHIERAWPSSFLWGAMPDGTLPHQAVAFESTLKWLMDDYPVGAAVEYLNERHAELGDMLSGMLEDVQFDVQVDKGELINTWMGEHDAAGYVVIGDPAVRLPVVQDAEVEPRPVLVSTTTGPAPQASASQPAAAAAQGAGASSAVKTPPAGGQAGGTPGKAHTTEDAEVANALSILTRWLGRPGASSQGDIDLFATPFSPPPVVPEMDRLKENHPELYKAYVDHLKEGYKNNSRIFGKVLSAFMASHTSTLVMYWILFAVGVGAVVAAIVLGMLQEELAIGAAFIGVGAAAFVAYFIGRSTQSVEENLVYITWLGVIYNSYWTHLAWATKPETAQAELEKATAAALAEIRKLLDRHATSVKGRPVLGGGGKPAADAGDTGS